MLRPMLAVAAFVAALWSADAIADQLIASWTDNSGGTAYTQIERRLATDTVSSYTPLTDVLPGVTSFADTQVTAGTTYCYRAFAYDATSVSPYTNEVCAVADATITTASTITVSVSETGTGAGSVVSSPAGINCGTTCSGTYASGSSVTVSATPASGSRFDGWTSGGCAGTAPCTIVGNTAVTITASFSLLPTSTTPPPTPSTDTTPPSVTLNVPATFSRKSLVTLSATASDNVGVTRVDFYINGKVQCSDTGTPYTCSWRIPAATGKSYVLQGYAYDAAGNVGTSAKITVVPQ